MNTFNKPRMNDANGENRIRRYVHSPLTIEHNGIQASIQATGKVKIVKVAAEKSNSDIVEYDEVEIPASLIFKLGNLLRATRKIEYVAISEVKEGDNLGDE